MNYKVKGKVDLELTSDELISLPDSLLCQLEVNGGTAIVSDKVQIGNVPDKDGILKPLYHTSVTTKRNKKVDVPTEQWQKSIERKFDEMTHHTRTAALEERIVKLEPENDTVDNYHLFPVWTCLLYTSPSPRDS